MSTIKLSLDRDRAVKYRDLLKSAFENEDQLALNNALTLMRSVAASIHQRSAIATAFKEAFGSGDAEKFAKVLEECIPEPKTDDWIASRGVCPVIDVATMVEIETFNGKTGTGRAGGFSWGISATPGPYDIRRYRLIS